MGKKNSINQPLLVGLTGSIGSGKSTVASIFESLGVPIYYSDTKAKWLMQNDESLKAKISSKFGPEIYSSTGELKRAELASIVFNDPNKLQILNNLVHPAVKVNFQSWVQEHQDFTYLMKEAAILFESKANKGLNKVICVIAPGSLRHARVMNRDKVSIDQVRARENNQWSEANKARQSHFIISNDEVHPIIPQVIGIHQHLSEELPLGKS